jgi:hypothetical protein
VRLKELTRRHGQAAVPAWPPRVWASGGSVFTQGHLGVLKSVQRIRDHEIGDWLAVVAVHDGRDHHAAFRCEGPLSLTECERLLREHIGRPVRDIGEVQV